ncbi:Protein of unknown function [Gryllus bimaculatus]|nr:Protein of unknown function [Gryllus bimaculatus]
MAGNAGAAKDPIECFKDIVLSSRTTDIYNMYIKEKKSLNSDKGNLLQSCIPVIQHVASSDTSFSFNKMGKSLSYDNIQTLQDSQEKLPNSSDVTCNTVYEPVKRKRVKQLPFTNNIGTKVFKLQEDL